MDKPLLNNLTIELIDCEQQLDDIDLDALVSTANVQHKSKYLQTLMNNLDNHFKGHFVVASSNGEIVAWSYLFIDQKFTFHGVFEGFLSTLYRLFPLKVNTAFLSSPVVEYNMIHISEKYQSQQGAIVDQMMSALLTQLRNDGVKMLILRDHLADYDSKVLSNDFKHLHFMPGTYVEFEGTHECGELCADGCAADCDCFEDYLMTLEKKWRANIRNKMNRRKDDLVLEVVPSKSLSLEEKARCHELYTQTRDRQDLKHERLAPSYFHECAVELGDCCKMLVARVDDKIIGFAQLLENEDDVVNVRMGMDYQHNRDYNLYFHLLYENIRYCLCNKKKRLYTSQTSYRPKLEVGAKLLPLHTYFSFTNPFLQNTLGGLLASNCTCHKELIEADRPTEILRKHSTCPH